MKELSKTDEIGNPRKRAYRQLQLMDKDASNGSDDSQMDDSTYPDSLLGMFKRAKKQENDPSDTMYSNTLMKLQTVKKKTFMR